MNGSEILRIVDAIHRDKNIDQEIVFEGIEQAILSAARKHFGEESEIDVSIARDSGEAGVRVNGGDLNSDEIGDLLGRIAAQTAKQVMIQKIREAERDALFKEYSEMRGHMVSGSISQVTSGAATVNLGKVEGLLPRSEQIPGEGHRVGERVRAIVLEVKKAGSRVKIILSRTHPEMVRRLFELEIPEIAEHVIEVRSLAREAGYRSKVAVSTIDNKVDCVGACVGVRGSRIKNIVDELAGERIDIVRWNDSLQVLVPNSLQPAEVEDVILCPMLGKVIVLVREDQLSLSIGKKGQNVRLGSKLVGWDIHVLTQERLDELLDKAVAQFTQVPEMSSELAENLVAQGFFTFDDLSVIEPDQLAELGGLTAEQCDVIVEYADRESARIEKEEIRAREEARALRKREAELAEMEASIAGTDEAPESAEQPPSAEKETQDATEETSAADADQPAEGAEEGTVAEAAVEGPPAETESEAAEDVRESGVAESTDLPEPAESAMADEVEEPISETAESAAAGASEVDLTSGNGAGTRAALSPAEDGPQTEGTTDAADTAGALDAAAAVVETVPPGTPDEPARPAAASAAPETTEEKASP
ncbi:MAG: transcription termination factor NusA [Planctomycetaceae bacterium]